VLKSTIPEVHKFSKILGTTYVGGKRLSNTRPGRLTPETEHPYPLDSMLNGPEGRSGREEKANIFTMLKIEPRSTSPASRFVLQETKL